MARFILRRLLVIVPMLLIVVSLTWGLIRLAPGNFYSGEKKLPAAIEKNIREKYGLDKPWYQQYGRMLSNTIRGDFGESLKYPGTTVNSILAATLPVSATLGVLAYLLALAVGIAGDGRIERRVVRDHRHAIGGNGEIAARGGFFVAGGQDFTVPGLVAAHIAGVDWPVLGHVDCDGFVAGAVLETKPFGQAAHVVFAAGGGQAVQRHAEPRLHSLGQSFALVQKNEQGMDAARVGFGQLGFGLGDAAVDESVVFNQ